MVLLSEPKSAGHYIRRLRDIEGLADGVAADLWGDVGKVHKWRGAALTIRNKAAKLRKQIMSGGLPGSRRAH